MSTIVCDRDGVGQRALRMTLFPSDAIAVAREDIAKVRRAALSASAS